MDEIVWLSTVEAARRVGVTLRTFYRLIDAGQVVAYRLGRVIRVQESDVAAFIAGARIVPGTLGNLHGGDDDEDEFLLAYEDAVESGRNGQGRIG